MNKTNMNPSHELIIHNVIKMLKLMLIIYKATIQYVQRFLLKCVLRQVILRGASIDGLPNGFMC